MSLFLIPTYGLRFEHWPLRRHWSLDASDRHARLCFLHAFKNGAALRGSSGTQLLAAARGSACIYTEIALSLSLASTTHRRLSAIFVLSTNSVANFPPPVCQVDQKKIFLFCKNLVHFSSTCWSSDFSCQSCSFISEPMTERVIIFVWNAAKNDEIAIIKGKQF